MRKGLGTRLRGRVWGRSYEEGSEDEAMRKGLGTRP